MILVGLIGLSLMTWLFPLFAFISTKMTHSKIENQEISKEDGKKEISIDLIIPVYNGEKDILATLERAEKAFCFAKKTYPELNYRKLLGSDGSTDRTVEIAKSERLTTIFESNDRSGKWLTLNSLVKKSSADWVIFADVGVIWPEDLVLNLIQAMRQGGVIGVAPAYRAAGCSKMSLVHRFQWGLEKGIKWIENRSGGPVSVHGATVAYSRSFLESTLKALTGEKWLNDDVVIPMKMRSLFPNRRIVYLTEVAVLDDICDRSMTPEREYIRRKRLVRGNSQWIRLLLPEILRGDTAVLLLCLRRVFRVFWAYWYILVGLGGIEMLGAWAEDFTTPIASLALIGTLLFFNPVTGRLVKTVGVVALASVLSPLDVFLGDLKRPISWT